MMKFMKDIMPISWKCPGCGRKHRVLPNVITHCSNCGQIVVVSKNKQVHNLGNRVTLDKK